MVRPLSADEDDRRVVVEVALATGVAVLIIAQQIAAKALRDGLFLSTYEAAALPYAMVGGAVVSVLAALVISRMMTVFTPAVTVPFLFGLHALLYVSEASAVHTAPKLVAAVLYLHTAALGAAVVSGFWSVLNERFDPYTARRRLGRVASGATVGGVIGGVVTWAFSDLPTHLFLFALAGGNTVAGVAMLRFTRSAAKSESRPASTPEPKPTSAASLLDGFKVIAFARYPRALAILVLVVSLMVSTVDYVFKAGVAEAKDSGALVGFFAVFYTGTGIATFVVQAALSKRALERLGVVTTVAALPFVTMVLTGVTLATPTVAMLVVLQGTAQVFENSLYRSGYELLYTPVPNEQKRSAKILIDLGFDRLGTAIASGVAILAVAIFASLADVVLLAMALGFAGLTLLTLVMVRRQYVASLEARIRSQLEPASPEHREAAVDVDRGFL
ncbi:MAG: Npt1/Npt2 family nucleotide transporter, partial [Myxococcota bacterium]